MVKRIKTRKKGKKICCVGPGCPEWLHCINVLGDPSGGIKPKTEKTLKMSEVSTKVKAIIVDKLGIDESEVTETASFTDDLGADSLDTVELIMEFEKEFDIQIPDDKAEKISTVGDAISFINDEA